VNQDQKVVARRADDGATYLYYKTPEGDLLPVLNNVKAIVPVESPKMADKLAQLFPNLRLEPGTSFVIMSLDN
jgi:hypothetical protein